MLIRKCAFPGCSTLGMGEFCIGHEPKTNRVFVSGRPWPSPQDVTAHADQLELMDVLTRDAAALARNATPRRALRHGFIDLD
jgi:hypothetical protein